MSDTFKVLVNSDGSFDKASVDAVIYQLVGKEFARVLYYISEDLLTRAVNYTPIKTGLLRSTGNVRMNNSPAINFHLAIKDKTTKRTHRINPGALAWKETSEATLGGPLRGSPAFALHETAHSIAEKALVSFKSRRNVVFNVGFATPYALRIHEGNYRLGARSVQATRAHKRVYGSWPGKKRKVWVEAKLGMYYGKVGRKYLTRAWQDNQARYFGYLDQWAAGSKRRGKGDFKRG